MANLFKQVGIYASTGQAYEPEDIGALMSYREATDGPILESKEVLGGFYLLDCANLDEAIHWAAQIPGAWHGRVEVRPVIDFSQGM